MNPCDMRCFCFIIPWLIIHEFQSPHIIIHSHHALQQKGRPCSAGECEGHGGGQPTRIARLAPLDGGVAGGVERWYGTGFAGDAGRAGRLACSAVFIIMKMEIHTPLHHCTILRAPGGWGRHAPSGAPQARCPACAACPLIVCLVVSCGVEIGSRRPGGVRVNWGNTTGCGRAWQARTTQQGRGGWCRRFQELLYWMFKELLEPASP